MKRLARRRCLECHVRPPINREMRPARLAGSVGGKFLKRFWLGKPELFCFATRRRDVFDAFKSSSSPRVFPARILVDLFGFQALTLDVSVFFAVMSEFYDESNIWTTAQARRWLWMWKVS